MTSLRELQQQMQAFVLNDDGNIVTEITPPNSMNIEDRLEVYQTAYYLRLIEALEDDYAALYQLLGEDEFEHLIRHYLEATPSNSFTVRTVGAKLADYLEQINAPAFQIELAQLEWLYCEAECAADAPVLTMADLAKIAPEKWAELKLTLQSAVKLLECEYNTLELWQSLTQQQTSIKSIKHKNPKLIFVWRQEHVTCYASTNEAEAQLIRDIQTGHHFADLCERMLAYYPEDQVVSEVAKILQAWVADGLFIR